MTRRALRRLSWVLMAGLATTAAFAEDQVDTDVALVCWLEGEVTVRVTDSDGPVRLSLFDRLSPGSEIRTSADSEVTLVLLDGRRFVLEEESVVSLTIDRIQASQGSIRWLAAVPELRDLAPLTRADEPGVRMGASRLRDTLLPLSTQELRMEPSSGAAVVADSAELRFEADGRGEYVIEVTDAVGNVVFEARSKSAEISLPPDRLEPGQLYYWQVSRVHGSRQILGDALFRTISREEGASRSRLIRAARDSADAGLEMILVAVDLQLGLHREACRRLESSAAEAAGDLLDAALVDLGCRIDTARRPSRSLGVP